MEIKSDIELQIHLRRAGLEVDSPRSDGANVSHTPAALLRHLSRLRVHHTCTQDGCVEVKDTRAVTRGAHACRQQLCSHKQLQQTRLAQIGYFAIAQL